MDLDSDNESSINTAQDYFLNILETIDKSHAVEIRFDDPMYGDLDFSVLKDRDYKRVTKIILDKPGKIANIRNIPEGITHLTCESQTLTSISEGLPTTMEEINCANNLIQTFDGKNTPKLKVLVLSDNELSKIDNLPSSLISLKCENNQLRRMDLSTTTSLKTLYCSNNPLLMLEHVPKTLVDFQMENNPFTEISYGHGHGPGPGPGYEPKKRFEYLESIFEYYKLKQLYETKLQKLQKSAFERGTTRRESVRNVKMVKPPCVSCKRNVGTVFKMHDRRYVAVCGDKEKPCNLDIQIYNSNFIHLGEFLDLYKKDIQDSKEKIIKQKMDTLFNYVSESDAVIEFKSDLKQLNNVTESYTRVFQNYQNLYNNESRKLQIHNKQEEIYRIQGDISKMMDSYKKTGNRKILTDSMEMQIRDLNPAIQNLRMLKYDTMYMEDDSDTSKLIQRSVAFEKNDDQMGSETPRVIKYKMDK